MPLPVEMQLTLVFESHRSRLLRYSTFWWCTLSSSLESCNFIETSLFVQVDKVERGVQCLNVPEVDKPLRIVGSHCRTEQSFAKDFVACPCSGGIVYIAEQFAGQLSQLLQSLRRR